MNPAPGAILISDPFLKDPNFMRTVVFLCEHAAEGSFGFVLNRPYEHTLDELLADLEGFRIPVYYGGPVQVDTLHFLHTLPNDIVDGKEVTDGIYWGGNFQQVLSMIRSKTLDLEKIRFFLGYSGWGENQLQEEQDEKSWLVIPGEQYLVFHDKPELAWKDAVRTLGKEYAPLVNYPIDPQLN